MLQLCWTDDPKPANITYQYHMNLLEEDQYDNSVPTMRPPRPPVPVTSRPIPHGGGVPVPTEPNAIPELDPELIIPDVGTNPMYVWEATGWTECTKTCDGGKNAGFVV